MKQKWIDAFMDTAERFARLSSAKRLQVGAVVVKDNRIISIGYNGMPSGWTNECEELVHRIAEEPILRTKDEVIHAEANAISKLAKSGDSGDQADLFCTHAPCVHCAKMIYGAGIKKVFYRNSYKDEHGLQFLQKCGIDIEKTD
jgi:dCMP deaminase